MFGSASFRGFLKKCETLPLEPNQSILLGGGPSPGLRRDRWRKQMLSV
jgi:hypothetical protein